jgi:hypothetical protein
MEGHLHVVAADFLQTRLGDQLEQAQCACGWSPLHLGSPVMASFIIPVEFPWHANPFQNESGPPQWSGRSVLKAPQGSYRGGRSAFAGPMPRPIQPGDMKAGSSIGECIHTLR